MSQSIAQNFLHITFSTKYREKLIHESIENEIHSYIGGICKNLNCNSLAVGGYDDHVHILCMLSKRIELSRLLKIVKTNSSLWIKTLDKSLAHFCWQTGYAAFSVSPDQLDNVVKYISSQRIHHNTVTFEDEFRNYMKRYNISYDEKYLWD